jgi:hypothetical protein
MTNLCAICIISNTSPAYGHGYITAIVKNESDTGFTSNDEHIVAIDESGLFSDKNSHHVRN